MSAPDVLTSPADADADAPAAGPLLCPLLCPLAAGYRISSTTAFGYRRTGAALLVRLRGDSAEVLDEWGRWTLLGAEGVSLDAADETGY